MTKGATSRTQPRVLGAWLLQLLVLQALSSCAEQAQIRPEPGTASETQWDVDCRHGEDGFASSCVATADWRPFVLRLSTADSQLSVSILHPDCEEVRYLDRLDLIGLSSDRRAILVAGAFADAATELERRCPQLPRLKTTFDKVPDISIIGAPR